MVLSLNELIPLNFVKQLVRPKASLLYLNYSLMQTDKVIQTYYCPKPPTIDLGRLASPHSKILATPFIKVAYRATVLFLL